MTKPLTIVMVAAEVAPFSKAGGLGDVVGALPKALRDLGHRVIVVTPFYEQIIDTVEWGIVPELSFEVTMNGDRAFPVQAMRGMIDNAIPVYFLGNKKYFAQKKEIYGSTHENSRFYFFSVAVLAFLLAKRITPDILHCHDWHTGFIPYLLKRDSHWSKELFFSSMATVYTIHNLAFQMGKNWWGIPEDERDDSARPLPPFHTPAFENVNCAKRAILNADIITTVSEQYAEEIMTKDFGEDLHRILRNRKNRLFGIVNGIDEKEYNPATDPGLTATYTAATLERKKLNKVALQRKYGLPEDEAVPLLSMVSRITEQKGFDLIIDLLPALLRLPLQLMILGSGDRAYEKILSYANRKSAKLAVHLQFDTVESTHVYAASDIFLMPSRFEPCGLGQMLSLRYGAIPVVHATGGLAQTISDFNPKTRNGNGFVFSSYDSRDFLVAITRALETYKYADVWHELVQRGMRQSFSWEVPAHKYALLYRRALRIHNS